MKKALILGTLLVAALLLGAVTYASADSATYTANKTASGTVTATATVNPKITLTIVTPDPSQTVNFGAVDPGIASPVTKNVNVSVQSNKIYDLTVAKAGLITSTGALHFSTSLAAQANQAKPGTAYTDTYSLQPDWNADPGNYSGTIQYTVTQQ